METINDYKTPDQLIEELNQPKQDFTPPQGEDAGINTAENQNDEPPIVTPESMARAKSTAAFVVKSIDLGLSGIAAVVAGEDDPKPYTADKDAIQDLQEVYAEYLKDKAGDIPPGLMCLMMTATVYGPKLKMAYDKKAANAEIAALKAQIEKLKQQNKENQ